MKSCEGLGVEYRPYYLIKYNGGLDCGPKSDQIGSNIFILKKNPKKNSDKSTNYLCPKFRSGYLIC